MENIKNLNNRIDKINKKIKENSKRLEPYLVLIQIEKDGKYTIQEHYKDFKKEFIVSDYQKDYIDKLEDSNPNRTVRLIIDDIEYCE